MVYSPSSKQPQAAKGTKAFLTPTDIANYTYCQRLPKLVKLFQNKSPPSAPVVWGLFEHDVFRSTCNRLRTSDPAALIKDLPMGLQHANAAITQAVELVKQNYPQFTVYVDQHILELQYRLGQWLQEKLVAAKQIISGGKSADTAITTTFPWKVEDKLASHELHLYGRTDALYNDGRTLVPEDIKTHEGRFSTLLHHDSHRAQLLCYSVMSEEKYGLPSNQARIFFSRDLSYSTFTFSKKDKAELTSKVESARSDIADENLPPVLTGPESVKCSCCYMRDLCRKVEKEEIVKPDEWLDRLTRSSGSNDGVFRGEAA